MQAGVLIGSDVMAYTSRVLVNGVARPHLSWSVDRDLVGDLPEQVVAAGGVAQASGNIVWASDKDVSDGGRNPWNPSTGWIPAEGDKVQIFAGDATSEWSQFVGVIDSSTGDIGGGFQSKIVDRIDDFSRKVRLPALVDVMPPVEGQTAFRRFRLSPRFYVTTAMRRAGFNVVAPAEVGCVVDLPAVGSLWPLVGELIRCARGTDAALSPLWPDGIHVADANAAYRPASPRAGDKPVQLTLNIAPEHSGTASVQVIYGGSNVILRTTATHVLFLIGGVGTLCSVPWTGGVIAQALFFNGSVTLRTSAGQTATGTGAWTNSTLMSEVRLVADPGSRVNGVQVSHPTQPWHDFASLNFTPTARVVTGTMHDTLMAAPATRDQSAADLLSEVGQCLLWPFWIDETGAAKAIQSDALRGQASVQTVTTLDDIRSLSWRKDLLGARSEIITSYDTWTINRSTTYSVELWSSSESVVMSSAGEHVSLIEEPDGEAWLEVDEQLTVPGVNSLADANRGIGSIAGGIYTDGATEEWATLPSAKKLDVALLKISDGAWKLKHTAGTLAAGNQVELRTWSSTFTGRTELWPYQWDKQLPVLRGKGKAVRTNKTRTPTIVGNIGPILEHDCKHWGTGHLDNNETRVVDAVTDFISTQVVTPQPVITGMRLGFDPRRQLGDVITVQSRTLMGVELKCLIVGLNTSAGGSFDQEVAVRVIEATSMFTTYADFAAAWGPTADYNSFAAAWDAVSTYKDFDDTPRRGTD